MFGCCDESYDKIKELQEEIKKLKDTIVSLTLDKQQLLRNETRLHSLLCSFMDDIKDE